MCVNLLNPKTPPLRHGTNRDMSYLRFGLCFCKVRIFPSDDGLDIVGAVTVNGAGNGDYSGLKKATICLAGPIGEARYRNVCLCDVRASGVAETDFKMAMEALSRPQAPPLAVVLAATQRLVEQQWPRITRLAVQLRRRGELGYDECLQIVTARR
jgi:hypothetical protein